MPRNQERNFGSDWRSDQNRDQGRDQDRFNRGGRSEYGTNSYDRENRFPEDYEQRNFSGGGRSGEYNRDFEQDREFGRNRQRFDDHHRGFLGDRDYNRDYNLGTGTSMRMNRYESTQGQDRGFFGKGPKGWKRSDDRIKEEICENLYDSRMIDASEIEVNVKDGHVTLSGTVDSREAKREVESLIDSVRGVEDVSNNIKLSRNQNVSDLSNRRTGTDTGKSASLS